MWTQSDRAVPYILPAFFESVRINSYDEVAWGNEIDMCPDSLYLQLTGKPVEDIWPRFAAAKIKST